MPAVQRFAGGCRSFMSPAISTSARDCASRFIHTENVAIAALLAASSFLPTTACSGLCISVAAGHPVGFSETAGTAETEHPHRLSWTRPGRCGKVASEFRWVAFLGDSGYGRGTLDFCFRPEAVIERASMSKVLEPEVAGGLGPGTDADRSTHPPVVRHLNYEFDGWLGDDLLETFPCFIVTARLAKALEISELSGFRLGLVDVTRSERFEELYPDVALPDFRRLHVVGLAGADDFTLTKDHRLRVSGAAFELLTQFSMSHCEITPA